MPRASRRLPLPSAKITNPRGAIAPDFAPPPARPRSSLLGGAQSRGSWLLPHSGRRRFRKSERIKYQHDYHARGAQITQGEGRPGERSRRRVNFSRARATRRARGPRLPPRKGKKRRGLSLVSWTARAAERKREKGGCWRRLGVETVDEVGGFWRDG